MDRTKTHSFKRRDFLSTVLTSGVIGVLGFSTSARKALAQAKIARKPLLTERTFNDLIPKEGVAFRRLAKEARRDLKSFIKKNFYLTDDQERKVDALTKDEIDFVGGEIDRALVGRYRLRVEFRQVSFKMADERSKLEAPPSLMRCEGNLCGSTVTEGGAVGGTIGYQGTC